MTASWTKKYHGTPMYKTNCCLTGNQTFSAEISGPVEKVWLPLKQHFLYVSVLFQGVRCVLLMVCP